MQQIKTLQSRVYVVWIDAVKGFTISLVVFHHVYSGISSTVGFSDLVNQLYFLTSPVRMPLFFLIAGFFAKKAIDSDLKSFINTKVIHFLYFYILWSLIIISFRAGLNDYANNEVSFSDSLMIMWKPTFTIWFLYSLLLAFVISKIIRRVPPIIQIAFAVAISAWTIQVNFGENLALLERTLKLLPFFLIGTHYSLAIRTWVEQSNLNTILVCVSITLPLGALTFLFSSPNHPLSYFLIAFSSALLVMSFINFIRRTMFFSILEMDSNMQESSLYRLIHRCNPLKIKLF